MKSNKKNWWWARDEIFDQWGPLLGSNGLAVYFCLCRHANINAECWPSFKRLAQKCGIHRNTAIRVVKLLEHYQLIRRTLRLSNEGDPDTNVYKILELPTPPISKDEGCSVVTEDNHPSCEKQLQVVAEINHGGCLQLPKGNSVKEIQPKETQLSTPTTGVVSEETGITLKNSSSIEEENKKPTIVRASVESEHGNSGCLTFNSPLKKPNLRQQEQVVQLLKDVPTTEGKQSVLDEFNSALERGNIRSPWNYLSTLVKKFKSGELVITQEEQRTQCKIPLNAPNRANKHDEKSEQCPYCDHRGMLFFELQNGRMMPRKCDHNSEGILAFAEAHQARILSMK